MSAVTSHLPEAFYINSTDYQSLRARYFPLGPQTDGLEYLNRDFGFIVLMLAADQTLADGTNSSILHYLQSDLVFGQAGNSWRGDGDNATDIYSAYPDWNSDFDGTTVEYLSPNSWLNATSSSSLLLQVLVYLSVEDTFRMPPGFERFLQPVDPSALRSRGVEIDLAMESREGFDLELFRTQAGLVGPVAANWFTVDSASAAPGAEPMVPTYITPQHGDGWGTSQNDTESTNNGAQVDGQGDPNSAVSTGRVDVKLWMLMSLLALFDFSVGI